LPQNTSTIEIKSNSTMTSTNIWQVRFSSFENKKIQESQKNQKYYSSNILKFKLTCV